MGVGLGNTRDNIRQVINCCITMITYLEYKDSIDIIRNLSMSRNVTENDRISHMLFVSIVFTFTLTFTVRALLFAYGLWTQLL